MKRVLVALSAAAVVAAAAGVFAEIGGNPFLNRSDHGELVRILPPPAAIRTAHDPDPLFAAPSNGLAIYRASYGAGKLMDHGGLEIGNAGFWAIYWNQSVAGSTATSNSTTIKYSSLQAQINAFINSFPDNKNYDQSPTDDYEIIQQYGSHTPIANSLANWGAFVDTQATASTISDSQIQSYLAGLFNGSKVTASSNTIYGVYFPSGMQVTSGSSASCSQFCGYHGVFTYGSMQIKYAVFPYLDCTGCTLSGLTVGDMMSIVASHEIREAVTDPMDNGKYSWYDRAGYEADDKCAWHNLYQTVNGGFWVQPEYSNGGGIYPGAGCVVAR